MSYDEEGDVEERGFKLNDDGDEEELEIPEGMHEDFGLDEEDPDRDG